MTLDFASVGTTAVVTAHMRALESARPDRLFVDDQAATLVSAAGQGIEDITLEHMDGQRVYVSLAVRTHYLDTWCDRVVTPAGGVGQVVILGAGLDTRAVRLGWLSAGVQVFELDRSDVAELKNEHLTVDAGANWHGIACDLTVDDWTTLLEDHGFDPSHPTLFIAEGLFMYLSDDDSRRIVSTITQMSAVGSYFLGVHFGRGALLDAETQQMSQAIGRNGYAFESVIETDPQQWLGRGWDVRDAMSIAQYAPTVGRKIPYDENAIGAEVTWMFAAVTA